MKVERCPDTDQHRSVEAANVRMHPSLLLRGAESDPHDIRIRLIDLLHDGLVFLCAEGAERRGVGAGDYEARKAAAKPVRQALSDALRSTVEEMPIPPDARPLAAGQHEIRPVHPFDVTLTTQPAEPNQWHAIGRHEPSTIVNPAEPLIPVALHDPVHPGDADVVLLPPSDPVIDNLERPSSVDSAYPDTEDVDSLNAVSRLRWFQWAGGVHCGTLRSDPRPYLATYWS